MVVDMKTAKIQQTINRGDHLVDAAMIAHLLRSFAKKAGK